MFFEEEEEELTEEHQMFEMAAMLFELIDRAHHLDIEDDHYREFAKYLRCAAIELKELGIHRLQLNGVFVVH